MHKQNIVHLSVHPRWVWLYEGGEVVKLGNFSHATCLGTDNHTYNYQLPTLKNI